MKKSHLLFIFLLMVASQAAWTQRNITGKVMDETGIPIEGASVFVAGTPTGTETGSDGAFQLSLPDDAEILTVFHTGYALSEMEIGSDTMFTVILLTGIMLSEAVVAALGIPRSEKSLGYAVSEVDGEELSTVREPNIVNQLTGRAAGVTVIGSSGNLG